MSRTFLSPFSSDTNPRYWPSIQTPDVLSILEPPSKRTSPSSSFCCAREGTASTPRNSVTTRAARHERIAFDIQILLRLGPNQYCTQSARQNLKNIGNILYVSETRREAPVRMTFARTMTSAAAWDRDAPRSRTTLRRLQS